MPSRRIAFLDCAKVVTAFLVVFVHCYDTYNALCVHIKAFHMPLFFVISGMLFHVTEQPLRRWLLRQVRTLLVPALISMVLFVLLAIPAYRFGIGDVYRELQMTSDCSSMDMLLAYIQKTCHGLLHSVYVPNGLVWFLFALFFCRLFLYVTLRKLWLGLSILAVVIVAVPTFHHRLPLFLPQALMSFPFFVGGYLLRDKLKSIEGTRYKPLMALVCLAATIVLTHFNGEVSSYTLSFGQRAWWMSAPMFYVNACLGTLMILFLSAMLRSILNWEKLGAALLTILLYQFFFINTLGNLWVGFNPSVPMALIESAVVMLLCYVLHWLLSRYAPWVLGSPPPAPPKEGGVPI